MTPEKPGDNPAWGKEKSELHCGINGNNAVILHLAALLRETDFFQTVDPADCYLSTVIHIRFLFQPC